MKRLLTLFLSLWWLCAAAAQAADGDVAVIAHPSVPAFDHALLARLYTGRAIEVGGVPVTVVDAIAGSSLRQRFLTTYLGQDEDKYRAYWTVRRHVGKGVPPRELSSPAEVIEFVQQHPGAIGYIDARDVKPGVRVLIRP